MMCAVIWGLIAYMYIVQLWGGGGFWWLNFVNLFTSISNCFRMAVKCMLKKKKKEKFLHWIKKDTKRLSVEVFFPSWFILSYKKANAKQLEKCNIRYKLNKQCMCFNFFHRYRLFNRSIHERNTTEIEKPNLKINIKYAMILTKVIQSRAVWFFFSCSNNISDIESKGFIRLLSL